MKSNGALLDRALASVCLQDSWEKIKLRSWDYSVQQRGSHEPVVLHKRLIYIIASIRGKKGRRKRDLIRVICLRLTGQPAGQSPKSLISLTSFWIGNFFNVVYGFERWLIGQLVNHSIRVSNFWNILRMQARTRNSWTSFVVKFLAVKVCSVFPLQSKAFWTIDCNKITWSFLSLINHCLAKLNYSTLLSEQGLKPWWSWYTIVDREQPPASCLTADPPPLLLQYRFFEPRRDTKIGLKNRRVREVGDKTAVGSLRSYYGDAEDNVD